MDCACALLTEMAPEARLPGGTAGRATMEPTGSGDGLNSGLDGTPFTAVLSDEVARGLVHELLRPHVPPDVHSALSGRRPAEQLGEHRDRVRATELVAHRADHDGPHLQLGQVVGVGEPVVGVEPGRVPAAADLDDRHGELVRRPAGPWLAVGLRAGAIAAGP